MSIVILIVFEYAGRSEPSLETGKSWTSNSRCLSRRYAAFISLGSFINTLYLLPVLTLGFSYSTADEIIVFLIWIILLLYLDR